MPDSSFISRRLSNISLRLVASPHYVKKHGLPSDPKELKKHICLLEGSSDAKQRWRFKSRNNKRITVAVDGPIQINSGIGIQKLCESGFGIAQLPSFYTDPGIARGELIELLPEFALDNFYIHLLYHQKGKSNRAIKKVVEYFYSKLSYSP